MRGEGISGQGGLGKSGGKRRDFTMPKSPFERGSKLLDSGLFFPCSEGEEKEGKKGLSIQRKKLEGGIPH